MQFFALLALVAACAASPIVDRAAALKPYVKPKSTDSRGPCPLLNTLANHGYLPHDGRNITAQDIGNAIFESTNWHVDFGLLPAGAAFRNLGVSTIKLSDLNSTPGGEHPASLTRKDASSGDSNTIDTARVTQLLADSKTNFLTVDSVAKTRNRLDKSSNPPLTEFQLTVAQGEAALMMLLMRDTYVSLKDSQIDISKLRAPKDRTSVWLLQEKFPTAQGWKPAEEVVQLADLGPISSAITNSQVAQRGSS
ncbi:putative chloroperoxidase [Rosellinia necatrix]|uniref:Putative chloroperoxidase n=1 Tax=Rosellinia necatrix TaxID=77044 RepID=A0A1W2TS30_ROSNE|nr:putative chloroperoxidase [Rosellinia necatrix]